MRKYSIRPMLKPLPKLTGEVFNPENEPFCAAHDFAPIDSYTWDETGYRPEARAYAAWDENGLQVLLCAKEEEICVRATEFNGPVYQDSCLECFLQPFADDPRYVNVEVNAGGTALIGFGKDRYERGELPKMPEGMNIRASKHCGEWWAVAYTIPNSLFMELYGRAPVPGSAMRGNFYQCDESIHPHFGMWNPIEYPEPDFHRPEWFGDLMLEPVTKL